jgi:uncharacterized Zn finger protein (UPF0148 family)
MTLSICGKCGTTELPMLYIDGMILCPKCERARYRLVSEWYKS